MSNDTSHSSIGASSAERWFACPGSVELIKYSPPQETNKYAAQGTAAHTVLEKCFLTDKDPWDFEGMEYDGGELDDKDIEAVEEAIEFLVSKMNDIESEFGSPVEVKKEVHFDLSNVYPDLRGTGDIVIYTTNRYYLGVFDYKHGSGISVDVHLNKQLLYYTVGAINDLAGDLVNVIGWGDAFAKVEMGILQPRSYHSDGPFRLEEVSADIINSFYSELKKKAHATTIENATLKAGSHCKWCTAKPLCPKLYESAVEVAQRDFKNLDTLTMPETGQMTSTEVAKVLEFEDIISSWLKSVKANALLRLEKGEKIPGYKLVKKKANRVWKDKELAAKYLSDECYMRYDEMYERKLISPAKAEKVCHPGELNKEKMAIFIENPDTGKTIAKESDGRQEVSPSIETDFQDLTKGK